MGHELEAICDSLLLVSDESGDGEGLVFKLVLFPAGTCTSTSDLVLLPASGKQDQRRTCTKLRGNILGNGHGTVYARVPFFHGNEEWFTVAELQLALRATSKGTEWLCRPQDGSETGGA